MKQDGKIPQCGTPPPTLLVRLVLGFLASLVSQRVVYADCRGPVVGVSDGDTITVLCGPREPRRVRLFGIDAPELGQPFGKKAKEIIASKVYRRVVLVKERGRDPYGRVLGVVEVEPEASINDQLVQEGYAWWYEHFAPEDRNLAKLEAEAREAHRGLWSEGGAVPPWVWRKRARK